jgi:gamma-glutamyltranspeptidase/glutathione hydrolase
LGDAERLLAAHPDARVWPDLNLFFGGVHSARLNANGSVEGAGDPRRKGVAMVV